MNERIRIVIRGAVQGVGFRPFVYRLAQQMHLAGWVSNTAQGVFVEAEGGRVILQEFLLGIENERPERAHIQSLEYSFLEPVGFQTFEIRRSNGGGAKTALVLPDIATCRDCLHEIMDPSDRRYGYPFTNCTNCGPRFTIIEALPYDRANTTMRRFEMCADCRAEYENPSDRRFHAQPNACHACGPHLQLWDSSGRVLAHRRQALEAAVELLQWGRIVAIKGVGGFHLMADAANDDSVGRLRERKHREEKPFALMAPSVEWIAQECEVERLEERALRSPEAPIVLLKRLSSKRPGYSALVAPGNPYLGVMLPYAPLHHLLMRELSGPLVATSGNRCDEPICTAEDEAVQRLRGIADAFLVHDRPIRRHADDSIVRILLGRQQILRRARGYAPFPIAVKRVIPVTLAVGGHMKNSIALAIPGELKGETNVFVSQHIGDLETKEALAAFQSAIIDYETLFEVHPSGVVCDLHPDYVSATAVSRPVIRVQHHFAHVASCMAENGIESTSLGVAWDGTGYGLDETIWGGEFILAEKGNFQRVAHFRTFPLPGGDAAIRKPAQSSLGVRYEIFGDSALEGSEPPVILNLLHKQFRCPKTSSVGRLFDAVAAMLGLCDRVSFEGQAAMRLEFAVDPAVDDSYPYVIHGSGPMVIDWEPMIRGILCELRQQTSVGVIAAKFHNTLCEIVADVARRIGEPIVVLTGGCFQNRYLTERAVRRLVECGFRPHWHQRVPPNDGGIALGQAVAARVQEDLCASQSRAG